MVLARNKEAHRHLVRQFENREVEKKYVALLEGSIVKDQGRIELKFRLDINNRPYQIYDPVHGKTGITLWQKTASENQRTRVLFTPLTGRTHQLRLHAAHPGGLNSPIVGDSLYGHGREGDPMFLHACSICITHPVSGKLLYFASEAPF
jgi:tRNA pseudouridine32 synthase/23S rRNA pseudouridine746 synthase